MHRRHSIFVLLAACALAALLASCGGKASTAPGPAPASRAYRMGFSGIPPKADLAIAVQAIQMWTPRSDAALLLYEPPWDSLLAGVRPDTLVMRDPFVLASYYRALGLPLYVNIDPTNGLNRAEDAAPLVAAGRSLTDPAIRQLYRDYVVALDTLIRPNYLGLASETNLVRAAAPGAIYQALKLNAAEAATAVRAVDANVQLFNSVQVETAYGRLQGTNVYEGIDTDRADFPFAQAIGLSSYPYFVWAAPESLPLDYYARLMTGPALPMFVIEGGWTSQSFGAVTSSPAAQRRYLVRHAQILDRATANAWFQITFTDLDLAGLPPATAASLTPFAYNGLVDKDLLPKPALTVWDSVFARPRR